MLVTQTPTKPAAKDERVETPVIPLIRVVDDEPSIQALFRSMCRNAGYEVVAYGTAEAFLSAARDDRPGCLVLDLNLPDKTGIDILMQLSKDGCTLPVIFMSGMAKVSEAVEALKLGSLDFVEKPFDLAVMLDALRRAVATDLERRNSTACVEEIANHFARLSPRETQVMELVVQGAPNKEIAAHLGLSPKTVEVHRANVMRKSEAHSVAELVRMHVALSSRG